MTLFIQKSAEFLTSSHLHADRAVWNIHDNPLSMAEEDLSFSILAGMVGNNGRIEKPLTVRIFQPKSRKVDFTASL